jgi:hypothetical protein
MNGIFGTLADIERVDRKSAAESRESIDHAVLLHNLVGILSDLAEATILLARLDQSSDLLQQYVTPNPVTTNAEVGANA